MMKWLTIGGKRMVKIDRDIGPLMKSVRAGTARKDMIVLHETVSPDSVGLGDLISPVEYLASKGLGIHACVDAEGYLAWAGGQRRAILYHTASKGSKGNGSVNTRSIGIELVSRVMLQERDMTKRWQLWWARNKQIDKLAQLIAWIAWADKIPLRMSDGSKPGVTTHWQVTHTFGVYGGHVDCHPRHLGGYFPLKRIVQTAINYQKKWGVYDL